SYMQSCTGNTLEWPKMSSIRMLTPIDHSNISHRWASYTAGMITKKNHICRDSYRLSTCMVFNSGLWTDSTDYCGYTDETTPKWSTYWHDSELVLTFEVVSMC